MRVNGWGGEHIRVAAAKRDPPGDSPAACFPSSHLHSAAFPTTGFSNKNMKRCVRVWAAHVKAGGPLADLCLVDPSQRVPAQWRKWTAAKWQEAAQALGFPLDESRCVKVKGLRSGRVQYSLVWGTGAPLGGAGAGDAGAFVYLYIPGDINRYAPLTKLPSLCGPEGGLASTSGRLSLDWADVAAMLEDHMGASADLLATAAKVMGLPKDSSPAAVTEAVYPSGKAPPPPPADGGAVAAAKPKPAPTPVAKPPPPPPPLPAVRARAAPVAPIAPPATAAPETTLDVDDEDDEEEEGAAASPVAELLDIPFIVPSSGDGASVDGQQTPGQGLFDPSTSPFGGLNSVQVYVEKGVAFGFLSPAERVALIMARAAASGHTLGEQQRRTWSRAQWDRLSDHLGLVFLGPPWFASLDAHLPGFFAGWVPDRRSFTLFVAVPAVGGTRYFTLPALRSVLLRGSQPPAGLPTWPDLLAALHREGRVNPGLATCVRADLRAIQSALVRSGQSDVADGENLDGEPAAVQRRAAGEMAAPAAPRSPPGKPAARPAAPAVEATLEPLVAPPEGSLPGKSPVELYTSLGLGFAFMKLGAADAKRIAKASQQPGGAGTWDEEPVGSGGEQQLQWLPDASHCQVLPALGRGVRAAWGAGRVYIYVPVPVDRFLQTTEIRAGFCDEVLRPASLARGAPFSAWSRVVDALADAAASNHHLHAALAADTVFPKELLPPPEDGLEDEPGGVPAPGKLATQAREWGLRGVGEAAAVVNGELMDDDAMFAQAQAQRPTINFAPGGMQLPQTEMLVQPWREPGFEDVVLQRNAAQYDRAATPEEHQERRGWPAIPELEARGVVLNDTDWGILRLHSFDLFVRLTPEGLVDLREAYGVDKTGTLDGVSEDWGYSDTWWNAATQVPADTQPADYHPVDWVRRPTLDTPRGDRRRGEETYVQSWGEECKRVYLVHAGDDVSVSMHDRPLDFRVVFAVDDATGDITRMPVAPLLRRKGQPSRPPVPVGGDGELQLGRPSGAFDRPVGAALADWEETWELPPDAYLCFSWDYAYVAAPEQLEDAETLAYEWLKRNRYKLRSDGSMLGTPLRLALDPEEVARLKEEEAEEDARRYDSSSKTPAAPDGSAAQAALEEKQAMEEALKELDREALADELDSPEVDMT